MTIQRDDLSSPAIQNLLAEHLADMHRISPRDSVHALDLTGLRQPDITFWSARQNNTLLGCAALRELTPHHGEIKSMRTTAAARRTGVGRALLHHLITTARQRGYRQLSLETGSQPEFKPARTLYTSLGFEVTTPFADYREDPNSVFMTLPL